MKTVTLAEAQAQLSSLIEMVGAGEDVVITIAGHAVAQMVAPVSQQLPSLADLRASMPMQTESAGDFIRRLRDTDRY
jgi:antitoxin (DNA-binding transcriptional repressor) of toxin-antitoxin stability system